MAKAIETIHGLAGISYTLAGLRDEYLRLWSTMEFLPGREVEARIAANRLLRNWDRYQNVETLTGAPKAFVMCINDRESGGRMDCYLGNGERISGVTILVPAGRGPFPNFEAGCLDALELEGLAHRPASYWDVAALAFGEEKINGFGYRMKGLRSPYLWGGTNHQQPGKYIRDGVFDPTVMDTQLGGMAVYAALVKIHPELALGHVIDVKPTPIPPPKKPEPQPEPVPTPKRRPFVEWLVKVLADFFGDPK